MFVNIFIHRHKHKQAQRQTETIIHRHRHNYTKTQTHINTDTDTPFICVNQVADTECAKIVFFAVIQCQIWQNQSPMTRQPFGSLQCFVGNISPVSPLSSVLDTPLLSETIRKKASLFWTLSKTCVLLLPPSILEILEVTFV